MVAFLVLIYDDLRFLGVWMEHIIWFDSSSIDGNEFKQDSLNIISDENCNVDVGDNGAKFTFND